MFHLRMFVCGYSCVHRHACAYIHVEGRGKPWLLFLTLSALILETGSLTGLEGVCLSASPVLGIQM